MKKIHLLAFIACSTLLYCCSKPAPTVRTSTLSPDLVSHFNFKEGTYWVYRDSITGRRDSFSVIANQYMNTKSSNNGSNSMTESITIWIIEYVTDGSDSGYTREWDFFLQDSSLHINFADSRKHETKYGTFLIYPFKVRSNFSSNNANASSSMSDISSYLMVKGNMYPNVAKVSLGFLNVYSDVFYVSDNQGIIKMSLNHPLDTLRQVWELERYHMVK